MHLRPIHLEMSCFLGYATLAFEKLYIETGRWQELNRNDFRQWFYKILA